MIKTIATAGIFALTASSAFAAVINCNQRDTSPYPTRFVDLRILSDDTTPVTTIELDDFANALSLAKRLGARSLSLALEIKITDPANRDCLVDSRSDADFQCQLSSLATVNFIEVNGNEEAVELAGGTISLQGDEIFTLTLTTKSGKTASQEVIFRQDECSRGD